MIPNTCPACGKPGTEHPSVFTLCVRLARAERDRDTALKTVELLQASLKDADTNKAKGQP